MCANVLIENTATVEAWLLRTVTGLIACQCVYLQAMLVVWNRRPSALRSDSRSLELFWSCCVWQLSFSSSEDDEEDEGLKKNVVCLSVFIEDSYNYIPLSEVGAQF